MFLAEAALGREHTITRDNGSLRAAPKGFDCIVARGHTEPDPAHDVEWQAFSPGKVLLARLIEQAIEHRVDAVHFLTGAQRYKLDWKPEVRNLSAVRWHAPSAKGAALAWYDSGRRLVSG